MSAEEVVPAIIDALETVGVHYMMVGGYASSYYGVVRSTKDVDFVVHLEKNNIEVILAHLGPDYRRDPQVTFETITATTKHLIYHVDDPFHIELFLLSEDPYDRERFARRCRVVSMGREVTLPTAEDVVVTKLFWAMNAQRGKDSDDVREVIATRGDRIDWDYVHHWCEQHGTRKLLDEIRDSIPPI